jgi:phosphoglycerate dehydrogenase-like enzyme
VVNKLPPCIVSPSATCHQVGRGATVDLDDLAAALRDGVIGGAGLDVFGQGVEGKPDLEPLPPDHALYNQHPTHLPRSSSVR